MVGMEIKLTYYGESLKPGMELQRLPTASG